MAVDRRRGARWSVVVLLLLAGLLGMHGLGGHHGPMPQPSAGPEVSQVLTAVHHTGMHQDLPTAPEALTGAVDPHADLTVACVAALTSGLVLLLSLLRRRSRAAGSTAAGTSVTALPRARWAVGPPDLVAGLCVSRT